MSIASFNYAAYSKVMQTMNWRAASSVLRS